MQYAVWIFLAVIFWFWAIQVFTWSSLLRFGYRLEVPFLFINRAHYYLISVLIIFVFLIGIPIVFEQLSYWLVGLVLIESFIVASKSCAKSMKVHREFLLEMLESTNDEEMKSTYQKELNLTDFQLWNKLQFKGRPSV